MQHFDSTRWPTRALLLICTALFFGCGGVNHEQGSGVSATEDRALESFDSVEVVGIGQITIARNTLEGCEIKTDDNLLELYETRVENNTLFLAPLSPIRPKSGLTVTIKTSNPITRLKSSGACSVDLRGLAGSEFTFEASDACRLKANGKVDKVTIVADDNVQADFSELQCTEADVTATGSANIRIQATDTLKVDAKGAVRVYSEGGAQVTKSVDTNSRVVER